jgi:pyruvate/2-oxoglutarate dehydrogenase complex dihydrolipoamide acyltransferase (E2) component
MAAATLAANWTLSRTPALPKNDAFCTNTDAPPNVTAAHNSGAATSVGKPNPAMRAHPPAISSMAARAAAALAGIANRSIATATAALNSIMQPQIISMALAAWVIAPPSVSFFSASRVDSGVE